MEKKTKNEANSHLRNCVNLCLVLCHANNNGVSVYYAHY